MKNTDRIIHGLENLGSVEFWYFLSIVAFLFFIVVVIMMTTKIHEARKNKSNNRYTHYEKLVWEGKEIFLSAFRGIARILGGVNLTLIFMTSFLKFSRVDIVEVTLFLLFIIFFVWGYPRNRKLVK